MAPPTTPASDPQTGDPAYWKIAVHEGHAVVVAIYGTKGEGLNAAVECNTCGEIVADADRYPEATLDS